MQKTIIEILSGVPDYRKGNAVRHKLSDILAIALLSVICNEKVLSKLNPQILTSQFQECIKELKTLIKDNAIVAIDGKTIRRSKSAGKKAVHIVTAFASELQVVLGQLATDETGNFKKCKYTCKAVTLLLGYILCFESNWCKLNFICGCPGNQYSLY